MLRKSIVVFCLLSSVFIAFGQKKNKPKKGKVPISATFSSIVYNEIGAPLPPINFYRRDGKYLSNNTLQNDANLMIMMFNPTCDHCEEQTIGFKQHIFLFKKTNLVLVAAPGMLPQVSYFLKKTKVGDYPTIQISVDSSGFIDQTFLYKELPQINIYNKDRKLVKMFFGKTPMDSLKQYIQ